MSSTTALSLHTAIVTYRLRSKSLVRVQTCHLQLRAVSNPLTIYDYSYRVCQAIAPFFRNTILVYYN